MTEKTNPMNENPTPDATAPKETATNPAADENATAPTPVPDEDQSKDHADTLPAASPAGGQTGETAGQGQEQAEAGSDWTGEDEKFFKNLSGLGASFYRLLPAEYRKKMREELATKIKEAIRREPKANPETVAALVAAMADPKTHRYQKGQRVAWRPGLRNASFPDYGQPVVVLNHLDKPQFSEDGDPLDLEIAFLLPDDKLGDVLLTRIYDSRRFEHFMG